MASAPEPHERGTLIDALLLEQRDLTAVERFARWHESGESKSASYSRLLPLTAPRSGEQYAFEVDLDQCSGCKSCVAACHSLNGLDEGETWRDVGLLSGWSADFPIGAKRFRFSPAHHHRLPSLRRSRLPERLSGARVRKGSLTGIVRHLDDQCIGCQYCVLMCPYEVPKYSERRGIVRKCDMCSQRLAHGEAPACVQACPNEAIRITVVKQETSWRSIAGTERRSPDRRESTSWSRADLEIGAPSGLRIPMRHSILFFRLHPIPGSPFRRRVTFRRSHCPRV